MFRTHCCGEIGETMVNQEVRLCGWVHTVRNHGGVIFIDLRDRSGIVQIVCREPQLIADAEKLGLEYVLQITGRVDKRPAGSENLEIFTGKVEIIVKAINILNTCKTLPFPVDTHQAEANEETRLKYRFIDLRRPKMSRALQKRHEFNLAVRQFLSHEGFWEIETPILTRSTPEGARDYLVPSRQAPGEFYALPQSPQIFKQMLMVSGVEKYFQIARCFRDEDLRADRQPEFTQIDLEMSFVDEVDVLRLVERLIKSTFKSVFDVDLEIPFDQYAYDEVMSLYQSDKPDLRYKSFLRRKFDDLFAQTQLRVLKSALESGKSIYALTIPEGAPAAARMELDRNVAAAKAFGAQGLIWLKRNGSTWESPIEKYLSPTERAELLKRTNPNDLLLLCAEEANLADRVLKEMQRHWAALLNIRPAAPFALAWVHGFPLLEFVVQEKRWQATHNPFTAPLEKDRPLLKTAPGKVRSHQYDLIMNGVELGSGSIRNHQSDAQKELFGLMGYDEAGAQERFGWMLEALAHGAPPHGGIAFGVDRIVAMLLGEESIREVIAFPKNQRGICPFSEAPAPVEFQQLKELGLKLAY
ncbi:MAG: aspartate--tRNA ligase [Elusimicrobia bacterium]|nr:aspartate--tRNA ligase [Elusimicrobiota bacterium]